MANGFSGPAAQIVDNYLERLRKGLRGIPAKDQEDRVKEIHSHIYEAYRADPTADDVARVLKVLDNLGEPAEVISARMPEVMISVGKKKKLPLLILAGLLIAFFGVPLGLSGIGFVASVIIGVLGFILAFYILAFSMILTGWLTAVVLIIRLIVPTFLGLLMLDKVIKIAHREGCRKIVTETTHAQGLFQKRGFQKTEQRTERGISLDVMSLEIESYGSKA